MTKHQLQQNKQAITLLESLSQAPTLEQRKVLLQFQGNGSIAQNIDREYLETCYQYNAITTNTTNAFATPTLLTKTIWKILNQIGFHKGRILEPAAHIGRFLEAQPTSDRNQSEWVLIEPDPIAHAISQQLHPDAIAQYNQRLEETQLPENTFDLIISNFPFGQQTPFDPNLETDFQGLKLHNYFWIKSLKLIRKGGLIAAITSTGTLDNQKELPKKLAEAGANLIAAFRLPSQTFHSENTQVTTDLIILQKGDKPQSPPNWTKMNRTRRGTRYFSLNQYFLDCPDAILGDLTHSQLYGTQSNQVAVTSKDSLNQICQTLLSIAPTSSVYKETDGESLAHSLTPNHLLHLNPYQYICQNGKIYQYQPNRQLKPVSNRKQQEKIKQGLELRSQLSKLITLETSDIESHYIKAQRTQLYQQYKTFTEKWGRLLTRSNRTLFQADSELANLIYSLEAFDQNQTIQETDILHQRVSYPTRHLQLKSISSAIDAFFYVLNQSQALDLDQISALCQQDKCDVTQELSEKELIFYDPDLKQWVPANVYLDGDTKAKLQSLYQCSDWNSYYLDRNKAVLTRTDEAGNYLYLRPFLLPNANPKIRAEIAHEMATEFGIASETDPNAYFLANLGTPWIETRHIQDFTAWLLEADREQIECYHNPEFAIWSLESKNISTKKLAQKSAYATLEKDTIALINHGLNHNPPLITITDSEGKKDKGASAKATNNAIATLNRISEKFERWIWHDRDRSLYYTKKYNQLFPRPVNYYQIQQNNPYLILEGSNSQIQLKAHQIKGVERGLTSPSSLLLWEVGTGKTYTLCSIAYQSRQKGIANKPLIVVPKATLSDLAKSYQELYPTSRLLTISNDNFQQGIAQLQCGNYETTIITHDCFYRIPISESTKISYLKKELALLEQLEVETECNAINKELAKLKTEMENQIEELSIEQELHNASEENLHNLISQLNRQYSKLKVEKNGKISIKKTDHFLANTQSDLDQAFHYYRKNQVIPWEQLGVDYLLFDEAHALKNLKTPSRIHKVQGATLPYTQRTLNSLLKFRYTAEVRQGKLLWATGTLPTNSLTELYTAQRFLQPETLEAKGLLSFDAWVGQFGKITTELEMTAVGKQKQKTRLYQFKNLQELLDLCHQFTDFVKAKEVLASALPQTNYYTIVSPPTPCQTRINRHLAAIDEKLQHKQEPTYINRDGKETAYNFLSLTHLGATTAIDPRNLLPTAKNHPYLKLNQVALNAFQIWKASQICLGAQILFCDQGIPHSTQQFSNYLYLQQTLIQLGIPHSEIAIIHHWQDSQLPKLYQFINEGIIRILIGSTEKCGTGVNIQKRLVAISEIDLRWAPYKKQQRIGRIRRQGNQMGSVYVFQYGTLGEGNQPGFDAYKAKRIQEKTDFIEQFTSGAIANEQREISDLEEEGLSHTVTMALLSGSEIHLQRCQKEGKLQQVKQEIHTLKHQLALRQKEANAFPQLIARKKAAIEQLETNRAIALQEGSNLIEKTPFAIFLNLNDSKYEMKTGASAHKLLKKIAAGKFVEQAQLELSALEEQQNALPKTIQTLQEELDKQRSFAGQLSEQINQLEAQITEQPQTNEALLSLNLSESVAIPPDESQIQELKETGIYQVMDEEGKSVSAVSIWHEIQENCQTLTHLQVSSSSETSVITAKVPLKSTQGLQLSLF